MADQQPSNHELSISAVVFTIFLCIIFGSNAVAVKIAFTGMGVFTSAAIRFAIAAIAIYLWARITGRTIALKKGQIHQVLIFSTLFTVQLSLFYLGLSKSNASRGTLLSNLLPFFILFLAHFFIPGDRITKRKFFGILLGFTGVVFMFIDEKAIQAGFRTGDIIILSAVTIWSCSTVYLKRIINTFSPFQVVLYSTMFSVPLFLAEALLWDNVMIFNLDAWVIGAMVYQSLITASFGFVAWNTLLKKYGAVSLHSFVFIMPIAGVALGGLVLGEPITIKILLALLFIVFGILVVHWHPKREAPAYPIRRGI
ncbi:Permease of the drug/metabolite transporter (DMT) superfamily [Olavius sp. associated proteobacterium Delta 1]|nr:Permease of the drug/metabolite transporter (DMT) superfamily [Olavius sp. associated proteobacterium Delta 1]